MNDSNLSSDIGDVHKGARITSILLAVSVASNVLFRGYGIAQKAEASKQQTIAREYQRLVGDLDDHQQGVILSLRKELDSLKITGK